MGPSTGATLAARILGVGGSPYLLNVRTPNGYPYAAYLPPDTVDVVLFVEWFVPTVLANFPYGLGVEPDTPV